MAVSLSTVTFTTSGASHVAGTEKEVSYVSDKLDSCGYRCFTGYQGLG
ncbi:MAG: hypothetical protein IJU65_05545 [Desulfovibrio sp.]|nr:hypothetical protein [Desulfovibrio sp.]